MALNTPLHWALSGAHFGVSSCGLFSLCIIQRGSTCSDHRPLHVVTRKKRKKTLIVVFCETCLFCCPKAVSNPWSLHGKRRFLPVAYFWAQKKPICFIFTLINRLIVKSCKTPTYDLYLIFLLGYFDETMPNFIKRKHPRKGDISNL